MYLSQNLAISVKISFPQYAKGFKAEYVTSRKVLISFMALNHEGHECMNSFFSPMNMSSYPVKKTLGKWHVMNMQTMIKTMLIVFLLVDPVGMDLHSEM